MPVKLCTSSIINKVLLLFPNIEKYKMKDPKQLVLDYMIKKDDITTNDILAEYAIRTNNTNLVTQLLSNNLDITTKRKLNKYLETPKVL